PHSSFGYTTRAAFTAELDKQWPASLGLTGSATQAIASTALIHNKRLALIPTGDNVTGICQNSAREIGGLVRIEIIYTNVLQNESHRDRWDGVHQTSSVQKPFSSPNR